MDIKLDEINDDIQDNDNGFKWKKFFLIILIIIFLIFLSIIYCRFKATTGLKVYEYKVTDSTIPDSFHGVKVVQFSDIYFGNTVNIDYLNNIVSHINKLNPDIVVFTGDLMNRDVDDDTKNKIIESLSSINTVIGKYAIKGDSDTDFFNSIMKSSGFINLSGTSVEVYYKGNTPIILSNVDVPSELFDILLIHEPDSIDNFENKSNLVLAGHSLNGQINLPIIKKLFLKNGAKKYYNGYYNIDGTPLYVSSGIGTTDFKYRLFNKPSITLYRLTKY